MAEADLGGRTSLGIFEASLSFMLSFKTAWAKSETLPKPQTKRKVGEKKAAGSSGGLESDWRALLLYVWAGCEPLTPNLISELWTPVSWLMCHRADGWWHPNQLLPLGRLLVPHHTPPAQLFPYCPEVTLHPSPHPSIGSHTSIPIRS